MPANDLKSEQPSRFADVCNDGDFNYGIVFAIRPVGCRAFSFSVVRGLGTIPVISRKFGGGAVRTVPFQRDAWMIPCPPDGRRLSRLHLAITAALASLLVRLGCVCQR